jgi:hypothetical protein
MTRPPTPPVSPAILLGELRRLRRLLGGLARLLPLGLPPSLEALRLDAELALARPDWLESAENQLDLIEEFAAAVWGQPLGVALIGWAAGPGGRGPAANPDPLEDSWEELDGLTERLCRDAERWHRSLTLSARGCLMTGFESPA